MPLPIAVVKNQNVAPNTVVQSQDYEVFLTLEAVQCSIDDIFYEVPKLGVLFLSPYQKMVWQSAAKVHQLSFHGDFYCIEYHKQEVACNGLLFNNIFSKPYIHLSEGRFAELELIFDKMQHELKPQIPMADAILKTYIQLVLAICSQEKSLEIEETPPLDSLMLRFQDLIEQHFAQQRSPAFYADALAVSVATLSKKTKKVFGKTPTALIQERIILEAKKQLHLTEKTVKEIAAELYFQDEYYFSRYFKKWVGYSPSHFRKEVGISIVATL
ncbi:helix-turn-helix domain-containing protein [Riemerella columbina]|uniref:helix-turn-helix domain-containing protein n=1 Tax=Riemerella columbina TaxID=103810 RepID=UPI002670AF8F|nr:AraC family transcriptional regulator [Riemerella columbina]WKS94408.1 AraC family transcriptional regulator [Riemerella columbina]